ncbi:MAG: xanthine dehydrogenase family protein molybdopterin-binding subunit, partial [Anaerolineales bacterium]|nr:xanthine dehydrogenase family protein molybdopterin-binding subunit [Anaerolineales bacterium]
VPPGEVLFENGIVSCRSSGGSKGREQEGSMSFAKAVRLLREEGHDTTITYQYHAPETKPLGEGGDMHFAFSFTVQAAQVAYDPIKNEIKVLRIVAASDGGRALNPQALQGQIEGGLVMGIGTALTEEYKIEQGIPQTIRWADYQAPLIRHMPEMTVHIIEHPVSTGPYGAKGIGELPSIPTAPAICNALYNAIGVRATRLPVKPEELELEV